MLFDVLGIAQSTLWAIFPKICTFTQPVVIIDTLSNMLTSEHSLTNFLITTVKAEDK
ncbi:Unknown protein sequence [Pseudomonas syringae pv. syringae]|nr:Unknown protein sequence [Pseudomonas syringae pv. syringae]